MTATAVTYLADRRAVAAGYVEPAHPCCRGVGGGRRCGRLNTLLYLAGWLCPEHQPTIRSDTEETR